MKASIASLASKRHLPLVSIDSSRLLDVRDIICIDMYQIALQASQAGSSSSLHFRQPDSDISRLCDISYPWQ